MTMFHEGQEVEIAPLSKIFGAWRKATVLSVAYRGDHWAVRYEDGSSAVIHKDSIRRPNESK